MPERPKRRKHNKNKRKNKSNRPDNSQNSGDQKSSSDSNELHNDTLDNEGKEVDKSLTNVPDQDLNENITLINEQPSLSSAINNANNIAGDFNNNSNELTVSTATDSAIENVDSLEYVVESPDQSLNKNNIKLKKMKSKSLDNEDDTNIVEVTEDDLHSENETTLALIDSENVLITHVESDIEWEKADELNEIAPQEEEGTFSVTTMPLALVQCNQSKSLTADEEKSLRSYLKTLNLVTQPENINTIEIKTEIEQIINQEIKQRLRKKALAEDFFLHRPGPPRILDVIDEEGSSESSLASRRQSYLSDKKSDVEDLEDEVFEDKNKVTKQKLMMTKSPFHKKSIGKLLPQDCVLVDAKIKEPLITEARGEWTMKTMEKMTGAEVVYLTDTSSSCSSIHEICDDDDDGIDTDVSIRMMTPTIEVTDTENYLKKTLVSHKNDSENDKDQSLNQISDCKQEFTKTDKQTTEDSHDKTVKQAMTLKDQSERVVISSNIPEKNQQDDLSAKSDNFNLDLTTPSQHGDSSKVNEQITITDKVKSLADDVTNLRSSHEIVVLSTDNIKTNLYVKDIDETNTKQEINFTPPSIDKSNLKQEIDQTSDIETLSTDTICLEKRTKHAQYDLETKVIKCEFNDAINNLIREVSSDSDGIPDNNKEIFTRQDSSSSVGSSQCTAKYNPNYESLNDISNIVHDETSLHTKSSSEPKSTVESHVKDVFEYVTGPTTQAKVELGSNNTGQPLRLKDLCVQSIATLPYGDKILEELASVSKRLQNFTAQRTTNSLLQNNQEKIKSMPHYRLPDLSTIETVALKVKDSIPPPIHPRHSSLKKSVDDEHWTGIQTKADPIYVCLSPSQKMLMDKTNTVITKEDASQLVDMHRKYVDRRGYNEYSKNGKEIIERNEPVVSFKSQTGSRLLALIRDPSLTRNIDSLNERLNHSLDELQTKKNLSTYTKNNNYRFNTNLNSSFKPIPPPRPRKYSSSIYESDESSDFTDSSMRSMRSERKYFHFSTGNLSKEIENDISSIQNMHRCFTDTRDELSNNNQCPRRPSLPKDLCEQQMEYIRQKEKEVEAEIQRLEALKQNFTPQLKGPRAPLVKEKEATNEQTKHSNKDFISHKRDVEILSHDQESRKGKLKSLFHSSQEELLRDKMYSEYVTQMAQREERKQHKVIKITNSTDTVNSKISKSMSSLDTFDTKVNNKIEKEFISKARERWDKLGIKDPETDDEREYSKDVYKEPTVIEHKIKVIEGGREKDVKKLPSHLQEFVRFTAKDSEQGVGSSGESKAGPATPHLVIACAVFFIVIAIGKYFLRLLRYK